jgi:hypothetical protein
MSAIRRKTPDAGRIDHHVQLLTDEVAGTTYIA